MKKQTLILVLVLLILVSGIGIVSADTTISGNFTSETVYQVNTTSVGGTVSNHAITAVYLKDIGSVGTLQTILYSGYGGATSVFTHDAGYSSGQVPFTSELGSGIIGWNDVFDNNGVFLFQYLYLTYSNYNNTGQSGNRYDNLTFNNNDLHHPTIALSAASPPSGDAFGAWLGFLPEINGNSIFLAYPQGQSYSRAVFNNAYYTFHHQYNATGILGNTSISGSLNKAPFGTAYSSRGFVVDSITNAILVQEDYPPNPINWNFSVFRGNIKIGAIDAHNVTYTSSALFPTSGVSPGLYDITFHVMTYQGTGIYNAKVYFVPDLQVGQRPIDVAITGYTDASGMVTFTNQSASSTAYVGVTATSFKEHDEYFTFTSDMVKEIRLSPPSVEVNLDIRDPSTGYYLENVGVGIKNTTSGTWRNSTQEIGSLYFDSTGTNYEYPISINETIIVAASKTGYRPNWKSVTIPSSILYNSYTVTLYLININATAPSSGNFTAVVAVSHRKTGTVIQGASVSITALGRAGTTGTTGAVTFKNIAAGTYTMTASAPGFNPSSTEITGTDGETVLKSIALVPTGCSVSEGGIVICGNETSAIPGSSTSQDPNTKAGNVVTVILDNAVTGFWIVVVILGIWFGKKVIFS